MKAISITKYAKIRGFPARELTRLCKEGIIPYMPLGSKKNPRYLVNPEMADPALDKYLWGGNKPDDNQQKAVDNNTDNEEKHLPSVKDIGYLNALNALTKKKSKNNDQSA